MTNKKQGDAYNLTTSKVCMAKDHLDQYTAVYNITSV